MRFIKSALVVFLIAIAGAPVIPITGQEEPLPVVTARTEPTVFLAVEPIREAPPSPTLADAGRRNDFATFDALYQEARERGESVAQYAALHELWTWSMNDPIGAFYGDEIRDRLARQYPGFGAYIDEYAIVDSNGNTYYPTSETRAFLLDRALERNVPKTLVAENRVTTATATTRATPRKRYVKAALETPPVVVPQRPAAVVTAAEPAAPQVPAVVEARIAPTVGIVTTPVPPNEKDAGATGILLLVIGIIGIGLLAVMLRTPREATPVSIIKPAEPIRKLSTPPSPPAEPTTRTGSHG
ncbi:MAG: hypothetical protein ACLGH0_02755 [Thermoanaerobaculia bacterium]